MTSGSRTYPGRSWARAASPAELGWSAEGLRAARAYAATIATDAVSIVVDGRVVDEWGDVATRFNVHSIRKAFVSALIGIHVLEGRLRLSDTLAELGIDDNEPALTAAEKQATVADLLKARSGVYHPALYETATNAVARPAQGSYPPGAFWYYNNWDFNTLGTILERAAGRSLFEDLQARIAEPIGMETFQVEDGTYVRGPDSIHPAYPFRMTARDMARFGLLYLRDGQWRGTPVVPRDWVAESTRSYSDLGQKGGYGYMWYGAPAGGPHLTSAWFPGPVVSAQGFGGHYLVLVPHLDLVVAHRVNTWIEGRQVTESQFRE
jgi:CubicO group peptidase (beta-lactamase class C family)